MNPLPTDQRSADRRQDLPATRQDHGVPEAAARLYSRGARRGWTLTPATGGIALVTGDSVSGVRIPEPLATDVRGFLDANNLTGPIIRTSGPIPCDIHLVTGTRKAESAVAALRAAQVTVLTGGEIIALPYPGSAHGHVWVDIPDPAGGLPSILAIAAAVRAVRTARPS